MSADDQQFLDVVRLPGSPPNSTCVMHAMRKPRLIEEAVVVDTQPRQTVLY